MKITYLPHVRRRMEERGISEEEVAAVLEDPAMEYPGNFGRTVAERVVVTVERGRPTRPAEPGGGEQ
jgi:hypothetical protein